MTDYYYGNLEDMMDRPDICRYRGYGSVDADSKNNDSREWQVLAIRLTFVIIFEVLTIHSLNQIMFILRRKYEVGYCQVGFYKTNFTHNLKIISIEH